MHFQDVSGRGQPLLAILVTAVHLVPAPARADDPKFAFGKAGEVTKLPPWAAPVTAGLGMTTGNAQNVNFSGAGMVSHRFTRSDLLAFDASVACQRSSTQTAVPASGTVITPDDVRTIDHTVGELCLDCTCQRYVVGNPNSTNIAAIRAYLGYVGTPPPAASAPSATTVPWGRSA